LARAADRGLVASVRAELARLADPARAEPERAYLKSELPLHGIYAREQRAVCRRVFAEHPLQTFESWRDTVRELWCEARFREERYAAIALTGERRYRSYQVLEALPLYEELIVTGAWWDLVDPLATHRVGDLLRGRPNGVGRAMRAWSRSPDRWKRRTSILCQIRFKADTDLDLLYACIEPNLGDRDFFVRKAIGWALR
jgi:3-methyladenine DNA glycosylase AlkD